MYIGLVTIRTALTSVLSVSDGGLNGLVYPSSIFAIDVERPATLSRYIIVYDKVSSKSNKDKDSKYPALLYSALHTCAPRYLLDLPLAT